MKLKNWVVKLIIAIQFILIVLATGEVESTFIFIISKLIISGFIILNHMILVKYSDLFESEV